MFIHKIIRSFVCSEPSLLLLAVCEQMSSIGFLNLLGAPARGVGLTHVGRGLDGGHKLESNVGDTDDTNNTTGDVADDLCAKEEAAKKDVENTTADKGEKKVGITRDLGRDLELKETNGKTKDYHVDAEDNGAQSATKEAKDTAKNGDGTDGQVDNAKDIR